jgi:hypothetical protein
MEKGWGGLLVLFVACRVRVSCLVCVSLLCFPCLLTDIVDVMRVGLMALDVQVASLLDPRLTLTPEATEVFLDPSGRLQRAHTPGARTYECNGTTMASPCWSWTYLEEALLIHASVFSPPRSALPPILTPLPSTPTQAEVSHQTHTCARTTTTTSPCPPPPPPAPPRRPPPSCNTTGPAVE